MSRHQAKQSLRIRRTHNNPQWLMEDAAREISQCFRHQVNASVHC
jgi:hypothetical protein